MSSGKGAGPHRTPATEVERERAAYWSGFDILWDDAPEAPSRRGPGTLDRGRIVRTAIAIADAEGIDALTMRRIAQELDAAPMSLYRHVPDKEALVSLMLEEVLGEGRLPEAPSGDWRADLTFLANASWALMRRHPWYPEASMVRPPITPRGVAGLEWALSIFDRYDLSIGEKMLMVGAVHFSVIGAAMNAAIEDQTRARLDMSEEQILHSGARYANRIAQSGTFPRVAEFIGARLADVKPLPARKPAKARPRQPKKTSASA
jgi:AcrR family transcriptional regulator